MMLLDRRDLLLYTAVPLSFSGPTPTPHALPIKDVVDCICHLTPRMFREGVQTSGGTFLYRGADAASSDDARALRRLVEIRSLKVSTRNEMQRLSLYFRNPEPDLLLPETYDDPKALAYFACLEERLSKSEPEFIAKPSNGHIGTSNPETAAPWGKVVSVWPLGDRLSIVSPKQRDVFFPYSSKEQGAAQFACVSDRLAVDRDLTRALQTNKEILFASRFDDDAEDPTNTRRKTSLPVSAFLTIPAEYDNMMRQGLEQSKYGLV
jgi:hypothetical protein